MSPNRSAMDRLTRVDMEGQRRKFTMRGTSVPDRIRNARVNITQVSSTLIVEVDPSKFCIIFLIGCDAFSATEGD